MRKVFRAVRNQKRLSFPEESERGCLDGGGKGFLQLSRGSTSRRSLSKRQSRGVCFQVHNFLEVLVRCYLGQIIIIKWQSAPRHSPCAVDGDRGELSTQNSITRSSYSGIFSSVVFVVELSNNVNKAKRSEYASSSSSLRKYFMSIFFAFYADE